MPKPQRSSTHRWIHEWTHQGSLLLQSSRRKGAQSLVAMSTEVLVKNMASLPNLPGSPRLPASTVEEIQCELTKKNKVTFHIFRLLSRYFKDFPSENIPLRAWLFSAHQCAPDGPFNVIPIHLSSHSLEFLAHIVLTGGAMITEGEFMQLASMPNLAVLEFIVPWGCRAGVSRNPEEESERVLPRVTDRMFWGISKQRSPFPALRVLRLWGEHEVTLKALVAMAQFPSLVLVDMNLSNSAPVHGKREAIEAGWTGGVRLPYTSMLEDVALAGNSPDAHVGYTEHESFSKEYPNLPWSLSTSWRRAWKASTQIDDGDQVKPLPVALADVLLAGPDHNACLDQAVFNDRCWTDLFSHWGILTYAALGQANSKDRDLEKLDPRFKAGKDSVYMESSNTKLALPPKPFASVCIGHTIVKYGPRASSDAVGTHDLYPPNSMTRFIYTRDYDAIGAAQKQENKDVPPLASRPKHPVGSSGPAMRPKKKQRMDDMWKSFGL